MAANIGPSGFLALQDKRHKERIVQTQTDELIAEPDRLPEEPKSQNTTIRQSSCAEWPGNGRGPHRRTSHSDFSSWFP